MTISDFGDPVTVGKKDTYEIRVTNDANVSDRQVVLVVTVPPEMEPMKIGTTARRTTSRSKAKPSASNRWPRSGPTRRRRSPTVVQVNTLKAGKVRVQAKVTSANVPQGKEADEDTEIFAE